jgi:hypothetical protein
MMQGGMPPQAIPPQGMDPSMMQGGPPPQGMDPSMMQGGIPPEQLEQMMSLLEELANGLGQAMQRIEACEQQNEEIMTAMQSMMQQQPQGGSWS